MRAIGQVSFGGPEVLKIVEVERPEPGPAEVLVRVHAAEVNPTDWWHRATGGLAGGVPVRLGWDLSGVIEAVGPGVTLFQPGRQVFGMPRQPRPAGTYAALVEAGRLRAHIDTVLPLEQVAKAHQIGEAGRTAGKIVLTVTS